LLTVQGAAEDDHRRGDHLLLERQFGLQELELQANRSQVLAPEEGEILVGAEVRAGLLHLLHVPAQLAGQQSASLSGEGTPDGATV
jgi:hypothetical protein